MPVLLLIFAQDLSHRGPTRIQQDVLKLISNITYKSIIYPTNINTCTYLFTVIMSYLKSIEIILLLIALFIAIAPDKRVICIAVVFKNQ